MKTILIFNFVIIFLSVVFHSSVQSYDDIYIPAEEEYDDNDIELISNQEEIQDQQQEVKTQDENQSQNQHSLPSAIYPIYISVLQDANSNRKRGDLVFSVGISNRETRERKFTRFNSTKPPLINPSINSTRLDGLQLPIPTPTVYNVTIIPRPILKHEPLIMVKNFTKAATTKGPLTTRTSIAGVKNITSNIKSVFTSTLKGKLAKKPTNEQQIAPPTGDVTEEEEDEEDEEEEDDAQEDQESQQSQDSSEENEESDASDEKPSKPQKDVKPQSAPDTPKPSAPPVNSTVVVTANPPTKGDTGSGSSESVEDDADKKKKKKAKKKKKKKGKKKAELHFIPAPLGTKADIIVRLDKVHKNVREIFSVVKGVFTDYVVKRPHVSLEFYSKGNEPHHSHDKKHDDHERSDFSDEYYYTGNLPPPPSWNPPAWSKNYPKKNSKKQSNPSSFSKRFLEECVDDEICDEAEYHQPQPQRPNKGKPSQMSRIPLPYPIYLESRHEDPEEYSPFDDLPPLPQSYFKPQNSEKTWVRTWDKKKTGLPEVADSAEASKRVKHRHHNHHQS